MRTLSAVLALVTAAALVAAVVSRLNLNERERLWHARADSVSGLVAQQTERADSATAVADSLRGASKVVFQIANEQGRQVRVRVAEVRAVEVPDTCVSVVAARDTIIDALLVQTSQLHVAYTLESDAADRLGLANTILRSSVDSLINVLDDRPRPRSKWMPEVGFGPFVGVCQSGPCAGIGVTLSWRVF